jgi:hypothetical protein
MQIFGSLTFSAMKSGPDHFARIWLILSLLAIAAAVVGVAVDLRGRLVQALL